LTCQKTSRTGEKKQISEKTKHLSRMKRERERRDDERRGVVKQITTTATVVSQRCRSSETSHTGKKSSRCMEQRMTAVQTRDTGTEEDPCRPPSPHSPTVAVSSCWNKKMQWVLDARHTRSMTTTPKAKLGARETWKCSQSPCFSKP
jgi:hypothetical protein